MLEEQGEKEMKFGENFKKNFLMFAVVFVVATFLLGCINLEVPEKPIPKFASCTAMASAFKESQTQYAQRYNTLYKGGMALPAMAEISGTATADQVGGTQYSTTNIQVEGVDEADIVKTDGKYIYTISNEKLAITEAYPAENAKLLSLTALENVTPQEMFIHNNSLLVFGQSYIQPEPVESGIIENKAGETTGMPANPDIVPPYKRYFSTTVVEVFDVSNKEKPELVKKAEFEGNYLSSRKIGEFVYFAVNAYPSYYWTEPQIQPMPEEMIPLYREGKGENEEFNPICGCAEIGYLEPMEAQSFITLASISMEAPEEEIKKETVVGSGENVFASQNNLYIAETHWDYSGIIPLVKTNTIAGTPPTTTIEQENQEKTTVHKFSMDKGNIGYLGSMEAKGHILNQFSMDEFNGYFRIATTIGQVTRMGESRSTNNIYVFGSDLQLKGSLEDLAPGEKIYSARFMGERAYMVTFKKVDPLFVIDLSVPERPKVLGKLKIPGYSDYLHPIDADHIIGIGKEAVEAEQGDFAWYQGIKMAVFDVSDVENPKEMFKEVIGARGTDSYALQDHKAFLYDKEKELLVIPILLAEYKGEPEYPNQYGEYTFQGAYVYKLNLSEGFVLKGKITHVEGEESFKKAGYYYWDDGSNVKRALYIEEALYTISNKKILANALSDLSLIKEIKIE